jgi:hypothetical protein
MLTTPNAPTDPTLIAQCGINCRLCRAYGRDKNACPGCRGDDALKMKSCLACKIKNCEKMAQGNFEFCFQCGEFPCARLKQLEKRYSTKYGTSVLDNLAAIREIGVLNFVKNEDVKWACPQCGTLLCMHNPQCLACGYVWNA